MGEAGGGGADGSERRVRGSEKGASLVSTSWVMEPDLPHLDPITQILTTSWNISADFLQSPSKSKPSPLHFPSLLSLSHQIKLLHILNLHSKQKNVDMDSDMDLKKILLYLHT